MYRNFDHEFEKTLTKKSAERKIEADIIFRDTQHGFALDMEDVDGNKATLGFDYPKEEARKDQTDILKNNLSKTGNTIFSVKRMRRHLSYPR